MPYNPELVQFAIGLPIVVLISYLFALVMRRIFGARLSLPIAAATLTAVLGAAVGLFLAGWFFEDRGIWTLTTLLLALGGGFAFTLIASSLFAGLRRGSRDIDIDAMLAAGESDEVEFKETARWNVREQRKDGRMELVIAKTIAAFLNSGGGTVVIGANDDGDALGISRDLGTLRVPDVDRYELWLRDLLSTLLGRNAAALPHVRFLEAANGETLCVIVCPQSPRPVYLTHAKDGASTELWVRVGNSTRSFAVDEAVEYVARNWSGGAGRWRPRVPLRDEGGAHG
ncbi:hypothetical protein GCM10009808_25890 [Microbacterium sediminicola]|uniref:Schlafen AlbA-2 domain-containing protein n=1 Tax=Microbacterium sediminicola TaxID=415210 RepID=A0ABP4UK74_9MICO